MRSDIRSPGMCIVKIPITKGTVLEDVRIANLASTFIA